MCNEPESRMPVLLSPGRRKRADSSDSVAGIVVKSRQFLRHAGLFFFALITMPMHASDDSQPTSGPPWQPPIVSGVRGPLLGVDWRGFLQVDGATFSNDSSNTFEDEVVIRRARLTFGRNIGNRWDLKGSAEVSGSDVEIKDLYTRYSGLSFASLKIGNHQPPFSLEKMTSSRFTTFLERSLVVDALVPERSVGLSLRSSRKNSSLTGGVYSKGWEQDGLSTSGTALAARLTRTFEKSGEEKLHIGLSGAHRDFGSDSPQSRTRPETGATDVYMADTGEIEGVSDGSLIGVETAYMNGPVSIQAEYIYAILKRDSGLSDLSFDGWYVYASWFLTGERRPFDNRRGIFGRVIPDSRFSFSQGGRGAWELAARISQVDLNDEDLSGGKERNISLGLSWYAQQYIKIMANYVQVLELDRPDSIYDGNETQIFELRFQLEF
jgi:phosphate-selective porin OprO/OprP